MKYFLLLILNKNYFVVHFSIYICSQFKNLKKKRSKKLKSKESKDCVLVS